MLRFKINRKLPPDFRKWLSLEQLYYENPFIDEKDRAFQKAIPLKFRPSQGRRFSLPYVEIPREETSCLEASPAQKILDIIFPTSKTVRFFFHPLMKNLFPEAKINRQFYATPTASFRTVLLWDRDMKLKPIMLKLHLSRVIVKTHRAISRSLLKQSAGVTAALNGIRQDKLNEFHFGYLSEPLNVFERKRNLGLIIRDPVPKPERMSKGAFLMPVFSLSSAGPSKMPLIIKLIESSGLSPEEYLFKYIIEPLIKSWTYLTMSQGLIPEPHAQNLLLEMDRDDNPKRLIYRDFEGVAVDFQLRKKLKLSNEYFSMGKESDFHADKVIESLRKSYIYHISVEIFEMLFRTLCPFYPRINVNKLLKRAHLFLISTIQNHSSVSIRNKSLMEIYQLLRS